MSTEIALSGNVSLQAEMHEGNPYAVLKPMCESLGLGYSQTLRTLQEKRWSTMTKIVTVGSDGKNREMVCIDRRTILMWLAGVDPDRCHPEVRPALWVYQDEAADALDNWASGNTFASPMKAIQDMRMDIMELQRNYTALVTKLAETQQSQHELTKEIFDHVKRIEDQTKGKRGDVKPEIVREYVSAVSLFYYGDCPCCRRTKIVDESGKRVPYVAEVEHYHHRSMNQKEHCWIVCKQCNTKLRQRKPGGYWFQVASAFQEFQRLLHDGESGQMRLFDES